MDHSMQEAMHAKRAFSRIAWACLAMMALQIVLAFVIAIVITIVFGPLDIQTASEYVMIATVVAMAVLVYPLGILVARGIPSYDPWVSSGGEMGFVIECLCLTFLAAVVGEVILCGIMYLFQEWSIPYETLQNMLQSVDLNDSLVTIAYACLIGPFFEEWVFRRQFIGRLRIYGDTLAIFVSALVFALFHLNIAQFFSTFFLGLVFGYAYVKTGKLSVCVILHGANNVLAMASSVLVGHLGLEMAVTRPSFMLLPELFTNPDPLAKVALVIFLLMYVGAVLGIAVAISKRGAWGYGLYKGTLPQRTARAAAFRNAGMVIYIIVGVCGIILPLFSAALLASVL